MSFHSIRFLRASYSCLVRSSTIFKGLVFSISCDECFTQIYWVSKTYTELSYNYAMRFIGYNSIQTCFDSYHILLLSNLHNNVAPIQKNQGDKLHHVIVALIALALLYHFNPILPGGGAKYAPLLFFLHHPKTAQGIKLKLSDFKDTPLRHVLQVKPVH